jgi:hypothetical protein
VQLAEPAIEVRAAHPHFAVRGRNAYLWSSGHLQPALIRAAIMTHPVHRVHAAAIVTLALSAPPPAAAQDELRAGEAMLVNYAFATQLGSGVYSISGRTLQIYRLPFGYTMTEPAGRRPGIRVTSPVTLGLVDFKPQDVLETGLPEQLDTLGFAPGIELDFELTPHWHFLPFAELGRAWELDGGNDATVYSFGAHAAVSNELASIDVRFDFGITYAGVEPDGDARSDDILLVEAGIEGRLALELELGGHPLDWGGYLLADYFVNRAEVPLDDAIEGANRAQFEIGLTVGPRGKLRIWRIPVPRVGIGYRVAEDLGVWRLVFGPPF